MDTVYLILSSLLCLGGVLGLADLPDLLWPDISFLLLDPDLLDCDRDLLCLDTPFLLLDRDLLLLDRDLLLLDRNLLLLDRDLLLLDLDLLKRFLRWSSLDLGLQVRCSGLQEWRCAESEVMSGFNPG